MIKNGLLLIVLMFLTTAMWAADTLPPVAPPFSRVIYEPSKTPGELVYGVSYTIWIPPNVKTLRGVIVHQHGCGEGACHAGETAAFDLHWQALAIKHQCALLGPSYQQPEKESCELWCDPRYGSGKKFLQALDDLAKQSGHPEITTVPWALWGHSGGAKWVGTMLMLHPDRTAAVFLRSGLPAITPGKESKLPALEIPKAAYSVPIMCNLGTREGVTVKDQRFGGLWDRVRPFFLEMRSHGALIGVTADPNSSHDCGNSRYIAIPWFDSILTARLPEKSGDALKAMPTQDAWLVTLLDPSPSPASKYVGDLKSSIWLPNATIANIYREYVTIGDVKDQTPPPAPTDLKISDAGELSWNAMADLESGLAGFVVERDGKTIAELPPKKVGNVGRKVFQNIGYSDTPAKPLVEMRFTDPTDGTGQKHVYKVISINGVGLKSTASNEAVKK